MGSSKFRQRIAPQDAQVPAKTARSVRAIYVDNESSGSDRDSCGSDSDSDRRNGYMATATDYAQKPNWHNVYTATAADRALNPIDPFEVSKSVTIATTIVEGLKQCCGRKGHPAEKCYYVCYVCKEVHEERKCPMERFYNMIRQWYVPTKHAGMLPEQVEKMLNQDARQVGI
uniref:CCHC-type domain-containing protein n=1 Tax=Peronospora matthiolae TaxID=2874970 RepID=A0AAV1VN97_9STRA